MTAVAPVCPISRSQPVANQAGLLLPVLTTPFDFPSAIIAANQAAIALRQQTAPPPVNNLHPRAVFGYPTLAPQPPLSRVPTMVEQRKFRVTRKVKYYNPNDNSIWIVVEQIAHMIFYDRTNGAYLVWDYGDPGNGTIVG